MYKLEKTILASVLCIGLTVSQGFAQAPKKAVKPAATAKKTTVTAKKTAPSSNVLKNTMD